MKYRVFGKLNWEFSALEFETMCLPTGRNDFANIDKHETTRMIRYSIDTGVDYKETSYGYYRGNSEVVIRRPLIDGYKQKIRIAHRLPCHDVRTTEDFDRCLNVQLKRLGVKRADFYLLHHLNKLVWPKMRDLCILRWANRAISDCQIGYFGFSLHDDYELAKRRGVTCVLT
jgi:predicted aldo/keto reductase-like oxidoreductase